MTQPDTCQWCQCSQGQPCNASTVAVHAGNVVHSARVGAWLAEADTDCTSVTGLSVHHTTEVRLAHTAVQHDDLDALDEVDVHCCMNAVFCLLHESSSEIHGSGTLCKLACNMQIVISLDGV